MESATTTLKKSKKLNNILLEELESIQFEQIREKIQDETHTMSENESSEKDVDFSIHNEVQNCENDDIYPKIEFEENHFEGNVEQEVESDSSINEKTIDMEESTQSVPENAQADSDPDGESLENTELETNAPKIDFPDDEAETENKSDETNENDLIKDNQQTKNENKSNNLIPDATDYLQSEISLSSAQEKQIGKTGKIQQSSLMEKENFLVKLVVSFSLR